MTRVNASKLSSMEHKEIIEDFCVKEASKYKNRTDFRKGDIRHFNRAKELGILDVLFDKRALKYTLEECIEVAKGCEDYIAFRQSGYYQFCRKHDLLEEIQKVLNVKKVSKRNLTVEDIFKIASNYNSKSELYKRDGTVYNTANKLNLLDKLVFKLSCENESKRCSYCNICKEIESFYINSSTCRKCRNLKVSQKKKEDSLFRLKSDIRSLLVKAFLRKGIVKKNKSSDILGCSFEAFKAHIENQFEFWMSWENKGNVCGIIEPNCSWDLDHIVPLSYANTEEDVFLLNHWSNFQPLCSYLNRHVKRGILYPVSNIEFKISYYD